MSRQLFYSITKNSTSNEDDQTTKGLTRRLNQIVEIKANRSLLKCCKPLLAIFTVYVGRSTTVHYVLFCGHTLRMNDVTKTFLLVNSPVSSKQPLCFAHGQR